MKKKTTCSKKKNRERVLFLLKKKFKGKKVETKMQKDKKRKIAMIQRCSL
jgi:hypothetical protein